jgi:hypothetical protein
MTTRLNPGRKANPMRRFIDAPQECRCKATITLRDHSTADCGRRRIPGSNYCKQHTGAGHCKHGVINPHRCRDCENEPISAADLADFKQRNGIDA